MGDILVHQGNYQHVDSTWYSKKYFKKKDMEQNTWKNNVKRYVTKEWFLKRARYSTCLDMFYFTQTRGRIHERSQVLAKSQLRFCSNLRF